MARKQSMMGSSKYEYNPEEFQKDYEDKMATANRFKSDLISIVSKNYEYRDGSKMSKQWKRKILVDILEQLIID